MNILLISHLFPPHKGGVETASYNTAKNLAKKGHHVVVLTSKTYGARAKYEKKEGCHIYRYQPLNLVALKRFSQSKRLGFPLMGILKLKEIVKKHKIQVIHVEGRFFPISLLSILFNIMIFKRKAFLTVQGRLKLGILGILEALFDQTITRLIYSKLNKIICVSYKLKNRLRRFKVNDQKLSMIPNGVDVNLFRSEHSSNYLNKYLKNADTKKKVIFAGRLDPQKGVEYLIRAIPQVVNQFPAVHFFILGNGTLESKLKDLVNSFGINKQVTFLNMIPLEEMPELYSSADILCLPSMHEGLSLSLLEALSMGLVIVASRTGGISEAITENENGFLFEPKNIDQLVYKLLKALNLTNDMFAQIRTNNRRKACNIYSWDKIVDELVKTYIQSN